MGLFTAPAYRIDGERVEDPAAVPAAIERAPHPARSRSARRY